MHWKTLSSKIALKNKFFTIHEDKCERPDKKIIDPYYCIERPDATVIAAFTEKMELIIVEQYRHPVKSVNLELPAGYIEPHETDVSQAAKRELLEETGYSIEKIEKLHTVFLSSGLMTNKIHFFIGFNAIETHEQNLDEVEDINVHIIPWGKILEMNQNNEIKDMDSVTGILLAKEYFNTQPLRSVDQTQ